MITAFCRLFRPSHRLVQLFLDREQISVCWLGWFKSVGYGRIWGSSLHIQQLVRLFRLFSSSNALSEACHHVFVGRPMTSHSHVSLIRLALLDPIRAFPSSNIRHRIDRGFSCDTNRPDYEVCGQKAFEAKGRVRDGRSR
ncbi:hypothetical protein OROGR_021113 [Orobanche gracilis]